MSSPPKFLLNAGSMKLICTPPDIPRYPGRQPADASVFPGGRAVRLCPTSLGLAGHAGPARYLFDQVLFALDFTIALTAVTSQPSSFVQPSAQPLNTLNDISVGIVFPGRFSASPPPDRRSPQPFG